MAAKKKGRSSSGSMTIPTIATANAPSGKVVQAGSGRRQALEMEGISKSYGDNRVLHDVSLKVEKSMHEMKRGQLRSGGSGKKVTSRKQAIAIGLSEARRAGGKVPRKKGGSSRGSRKK